MVGLCKHQFVCDGSRLVCLDRFGIDRIQSRNMSVGMGVAYLRQDGLRTNHVVQGAKQQRKQMGCSSSRHLFAGVWGY